jgi:hypothetical protein
MSSDPAELQAEAATPLLVVTAHPGDHDPGVSTILV